MKQFDSSSFRSIVAACLIIAFAAVYSSISAEWEDRSDELPGMNSSGKTVAWIVIPVAIAIAVATPIIIVYKRNESKRAENGGSPENDSEMVKSQKRHTGIAASAE